jgi:hypothetical protein
MHTGSNTPFNQLNRALGVIMCYYDTSRPLAMLALVGSAEFRSAVYAFLMILKLSRTCSKVGRSLSK